MITIFKGILKPKIFISNIKSMKFTVYLEWTLWFCCHGRRVSMPCIFFILQLSYIKVAVIILQVEMCYSPIIQSGGKFSLKFSAARLVCRFVLMQWHIQNHLNHDNFFAKIVNSWKSLTIVAKALSFGVWQDSQWRRNGIFSKTN